MAVLPTLNASDTSEARHKRLVFAAQPIATLPAWLTATLEHWATNMRMLEATGWCPAAPQPRAACCCS
jgi:hypothetical protein